MLPGQTASGDINPSRFVSKSGAFTVAQCGAGAVAVGISQEGSKAVPLPGASSLAASSGDPLAVYADNESCLLEAGAAYSAGAYLKSDSTGRGVTASTGDAYYARAEQAAGAAGVKAVVYFTKGITP
jgi:hypothetical protein